MFGLFTSPVFQDPVLGEFTRSRGYWRGTLQLSPGSTAPLILTGACAKPDAQAIAIARTLSGALATWRSSIEAALFDHYQPYAEALATGELPAPGEALPNISSASDIWLHVTLAFVSITPLDGALTVELGYTTDWDEEHTLGARFQDGKLLELCGSVLPP